MKEFFHCDAYDLDSQESNLKGMALLEYDDKFISTFCHSGRGKIFVTLISNKLHINVASGSLSSCFFANENKIL